MKLECRQYPVECRFSCTVGALPRCKVRAISQPSMTFIFRQAACGLTVLFCSLAVLDPRVGQWPHHGRTFSIHPCPPSFLLTLPRGIMSTVHVLMLSIQAVRGLPRLRARGIVPCISLSPGNSLVSSWCDHIMLASLL